MGVSFSSDTSNKKLEVSEEKAGLYTVSFLKKTKKDAVSIPYAENFNHLQYNNQFTFYKNQVYITE